MVDVVFDASALILTAKIGLLSELTDEIEIHVAEEVYEESTKADTYDAKLIKERGEKDKFNRENISQDSINRLMEKFNLDKGESSAIRLYNKVDADILATDDKQAINTCKILEVRFTTSLKLLEQAYQKELLSQEKALAKLRELEKFGWFSDTQVKTTENNIRGEN